MLFPVANGPKLIFNLSDQLVRVMLGELNYLLISPIS